jgi:hypothetical protein
MASYAVFLAACGYEYHGPKGYLAFAPRLSPDDFCAAFTAAEAWGTFRQTRHDRQMTAAVNVKWGRLKLKRLRLTVKNTHEPHQATVTLSGNAVGNVSLRRVLLDSTVEIELPDAFWIEPGQGLEVILN